MRPLVVVFDDIHWAEPTFLDLVEHLADWTRDAPLLLVCRRPARAARAAPGLGRRQAERDAILLEPLRRRRVRTRLIENLLGHAPPAEERTATRIVEAAEGNPLFVEEMFSMLIDDGVLRREDGRVARRRRDLADDRGAADDPGAPRRAARPARRTTSGR